MIRGKDHSKMEKRLSDLSYDEQVARLDRYGKIPRKYRGVKGPGRGEPDPSARIIAARMITSTYQ